MAWMDLTALAPSDGIVLGYHVQKSTNWEALLCPGIIRRQFLHLSTAVTSLSKIHG